MLCKNCQKEIDDDSKFCEFCSTKVENITQVSAPGFWKTLFSKNSLCFWIFLFGMILFIAALFIGEEYFGGSYSSNEAFYTFLRLYIFCTSLYLIILKRNEKNLNIIFPFIITGIIFNPFLVFRFNSNFPSIVFYFMVVLFGYFIHREYKKINPGLKAAYKKWIKE